VSDGLCWKRPRGATAHGSFDWELASMRPLFLLCANTLNRCGSFSDGKKSFGLWGKENVFMIG
jgi:hypothetical protein